MAETSELDTVLLSSKAQWYLGYKLKSFYIYTALEHNDSEQNKVM